MSIIWNFDDWRTNNKKKRIKHDGKSSQTESRSRIAWDKCVFYHGRAAGGKIIWRLRRKWEKLIANIAFDTTAGGKIIRRLRRKWKKLIANIALDIDYSLSITLMVCVASSNKWILKIRAIYHFYSFTELFVASWHGIQYGCDEKWSTSSQKKI